jgi:hypothetical protein
VSSSVQYGRPTDFLPHLVPTDVLYACGAPAVVDSVKAIAARIGAICYADPFLPTTDDIKNGPLARAKEWLPALTRKRVLAPDRPRSRGQQPVQVYRG